MSQLEINSKKIETLTKVARLLGDQIQAQGKIISKLQSEIDWIKETLKQGADEDTSFKDNKKPIINIVDSQESEKQEEVIIADTSQITVQKTPKEKKSEKEELLQALSIIDNL